MFSTEGIYLAAIIQGLFQISVLIFIQRGDRRANQMLALLVGLLVLSLWNLYTYFLDLPAYWRILDFDDWYSIFFWGPVMYFYVGMISKQVQLTGAILLRHFSLGIFLFISGITVQILNSKGLLSQSHADLISNIRLLVFYIQMSLYFLMSFQLLKSYNLKIRDRFSSIDEMNLSWLQRLISIFAIMIAVDMCITVPSVLKGTAVIPYIEYYLFAEAVTIFAIGYFSLLHTETLFRNIKPKYESSPLDNQLSQDLTTKLKAVMQDSEPYKNNDLKLDDLAQLVGVSPYYLSQVINEQCEKNFYDFINEYRARSAAELLTIDQNINISQVAYSVGFNNRVSFNKAFKKHTGMTPSQYRRSQNQTYQDHKESV